MIRKQRVVADRDSRKIMTGNETSGYYENAISQTGKQEPPFGGTAATNVHGSIQRQNRASERSGSFAAPGPIDPCAH